MSTFMMEIIVNKYTYIHTYRDIQFLHQSNGRLVEYTP